jgi:hypothetical protein
MIKVKSCDTCISFYYMIFNLKSNSAYLFLLSSSLLNDTVISSDYIVQNDVISNELERMWKETVMA